MENKVVWMIYKHNRKAIFTKQAPIQENAQSVNPSGVFRVELAYSNCLAKVYKDNKFGLLPFPLTNKLLRNWSFDYETITSAEDGTTTKWYRTPTGGYDHWDEKRMLDYFTKGNKKGYYAVDIRQLSDEEMEQLTKEINTNEVNKKRAYENRIEISSIKMVAEQFYELYKTWRKTNQNIGTDKDIEEEMNNAMEDYHHAVILAEALDGKQIKPVKKDACNFWLYSFYNKTHRGESYSIEVYSNWDVECAELKTLEDVFESKELYCQKFVSTLQWFKDNQMKTEIPLAAMESKKDFIKFIVPTLSKRIWNDPNVILVNRGYRNGFEILYHKKDVASLALLFDTETEEGNKQIFELLFQKSTKKTKGV